MRTRSLTCQTCGADLEIKDNIAFCSYCGAKLLIDTGNRAITHNINYNKTNVERDETRIREAELNATVRLKEIDHQEKEYRQSAKVVLLIFGCLFLFIGVILLSIVINKWTSEVDGKIHAGSSSDYIGENYEAVVKQFEEMGFTNIITVDIGDSGLAFWNNGKVESVSINGDDHFDSIEYFYPDDKVIIKYH